MNVSLFCHFTFVKVSMHMQSVITNRYYINVTKHFIKQIIFVVSKKESCLSQSGETPESAVGSHKK